MKNNIVERADKMLYPAAGKLETVRMMYEVFVGTDKDRLGPHGSMDAYCENCIQAAIHDKKRDYFIERMQEMGKIYEYELYGYYRQPSYTWDKEGNNTGLVIKKISHKHPKKDVVRQLKLNLRKKFPASMIFSFEQWDVSCSEHDGFELCDGCGVMFEEGLILDDQELEHWESRDSFKGLHKDPDSAYCLSKIFGEYGAKSEFAPRLEAIAQRLISDNKK